MTGLLLVKQSLYLRHLTNLTVYRLPEHTSDSFNQNKNAYQRWVAPVLS